MEGADVGSRGPKNHAGNSLHGWERPRKANQNTGVGRNMGGKAQRFVLEEKNVQGKNWQKNIGGRQRV